MKYVFKKLRYKVAIPLLDIAGSILFYPIKLFKKIPPLNPKNILVIRLDHIGDFVCTTPIFKNIRKRFPEAKITVLINSVSKDLAYRDPNIDKVITFAPFYLGRGEESSAHKGLMRVIKDIRNIGFDLGIEPRGDLLSIIIMWLGGVKYRVGYGITGGGFLLHKESKYDGNIHIVDRNLALLKELDITIEDGSPAVYFNEKDEDEVLRLLRALKRPRSDEEGAGLAMTKKAVVLHPFAGAKAKEWSKDNFQKLINRLKEDGRHILLVGSKDDPGAFENVIDMRGKINLPQLAYLIKSAGSFIGLDSGPANIAAVLNVPSIIICSGTNVPQLWIPNNSNVKFIYRDTECKPCENKICPKEKHECMELISVDDVYDKFKEIANGKMGQSPSGTVPIFPMKVYFDARMIDHPGIGRYIRCLVPLMAEDKSLDLWVLGNREKIKKFLCIEKNIVDFDYPIYSIQEQIGYLRLKKEIALAASRPRNDMILHIPHYNIPVLAKFKLVATVHDIIHITYPEGASGRLAPVYMKLMMKRILKSAKAVICVSQATKDEIGKRFIDSRFHGNDKLQVIYEGVDKVFDKITDLAYLKRVKEKYKLPDEFILYVGSIRRHKNIEVLLDSFSQFRKRVPKAQLVMVGRLNQDIDIKRDGVMYLGEIESDKELAAIYNLAYCLLNLSLYEGFGLTILEAQKCGLPVICSDIAVHKEVGGEGIAGVKTSCIDPSALLRINGECNRTIDQICDSLYNILSNRSMRESLILRGLKNAGRFDWCKTARDTIDLYRRIDDEGSDSSRLASGNAWRRKDPQCLL